MLKGLYSPLAEYNTPFNKSCFVQFAYIGTDDEALAYSEMREVLYETLPLTLEPSYVVEKQYVILGMVSKHVDGK